MLQPANSALRSILGSGYPDDPAMRAVMLERINSILSSWKVDTSDVRELLRKTSTLYPPIHNGGGK